MWENNSSTNLSTKLWWSSGFSFELRWQQPMVWNNMCFYFESDFINQSHDYVSIDLYLYFYKFFIWYKLVFFSTTTFYYRFQLKFLIQYAVLVRLLRVQNMLNVTLYVMENIHVNQQQSFIPQTIIHTMCYAVVMIHHVQELYMHHI